MSKHSKFEVFAVVLVAAFMVVIMGLLFWDTYWRMPRLEQKWEEYNKAHAFTLKSRVLDVDLEFKKFKCPEGKEIEALCWSIILDGQHRITYGQKGKVFTTARLTLPFERIYHGDKVIPLNDESLAVLLKAVKNKSPVSFRGRRHDDGTVTIDEVRKEENK